MGESQRDLFVKNLRTAMTRRGIEQADIVAELGISATTVSDWVNGKKYPRVDSMERLADFLGVRISDLTREPDTATLPAGLRPLSDLHRQRVPLIGKVAAGAPIMAEQDYETYVDGPLACDAALEVQGDSMVPTYLPGDIVYIRHRPDVSDGQVAVVLLDDSATLKHVYHDPDGLTLISDNAAYPPIRAHADAYTYIAIYGVPVGFTRMYRKDAKITKGMRK